MIDSTTFRMTCREPTSPLMVAFQTLRNSEVFKLSDGSGRPVLAWSYWSSRSANRQTTKSSEGMIQKTWPPDPGLKKISLSKSGICPSVLTSNNRLNGKCGLYTNLRLHARTYSAGTNCCSFQRPSCKSRYPKRAISVGRTAVPPPPGGMRHLRVLLEAVTKASPSQGTCQPRPHIFLEFHPGHMPHNH
jgi:hypothetical protein